VKIAGWALSVLVFAYNLTAAAQSLRLYPEAVSLAGPGSTQRYVVMATGADGIDRDVTAEAALRSSNAQAVAVDATAGTLRGGREGTARIEALYRGQRASADVLVGSSRADLTVSFNPDILSILTTKGCNTAACHGSIAGKSGFNIKRHTVAARSCPWVRMTTRPCSSGCARAPPSARPVPAWCG